MPDALRFPAVGTPAPEILGRLQEMQPDPLYTHWARAFRAPPDVQEIGRAAYNMFLSDNGLFAMRTDYIRQVEEDVLAMCVSLFHPPEGAGGTFTSGGSESVYSALHAMREWARDRKPHIRAPEVVVPVSAHPTFSKGSHYFGLTLIRVPLGPDQRADVRAMENAVTPNTIGIVGSAPCWPFGLYDPIAEIGRVAADHDLWMHVDACVGGYLAPWVEQLGGKLPAWDFRIPAVKSISADLHKFGYCPKPASTIFWRSEDLKRYHHVHPDDWPGGSYKMQGMAGTRSAGPIFASWAVINYLGREGYLRLAKQVLAAKAELAEGIRGIEGLFVFENDLLPLAFGTTSIDPQLVMGEIRKIGWIIVATASPPLINVPIDAAADSTVIQAFIADLRTVAARARGGEASARAELAY